jgi:hypothetical protein
VQLFRITRSASSRLACARPSPSKDDSIAAPSAWVARQPKFWMKKVPTFFDYTGVADRPRNAAKPPAGQNGEDAALPEDAVLSRLAALSRPAARGPIPPSSRPKCENRPGSGACDPRISTDLDGRCTISNVESRLRAYLKLDSRPPIPQNRNGPIADDQRPET